MINLTTYDPAPFLAQDRRNALAGIDILRKVCNHPDLLQRAKWEGAPDYGNPARSGKLTVAMKARHPVKTLIPIVWHAHHTPSQSQTCIPLASSALLMVTQKLWLQGSSKSWVCCSTLRPKTKPCVKFGICVTF